MNGSAMFGRDTNMSPTTLHSNQKSCSHNGKDIAYATCITIQRETSYHSRTLTSQKLRNSK